ncbi:MAG: hypothetical protein ABJF01_03885 [bacterium]
MNPTDPGPTNPADEGAGAGETPSEVKQITTEALKDAVADPRHDLAATERLVRDYVKILKEQGFRPDRAVTEAKALVVEATGDPLSSILASVESWTMSVFNNV